MPRSLNPVQFGLVFPNFSAGSSKPWNKNKHIENQLKRELSKCLLIAKCGVMAVYYSNNHVLVVEDTLSIRRSIGKHSRRNGANAVRR